MRRWWTARHAPPALPLWKIPGTYCTVRPTAGRQYRAEGTRTYSYDYYIPHILLADRPQGVPLGVHQTRLGQRSYYGAYGTGWTSDSRRTRDFLAKVSNLLSSGKHSCFPGGKWPGREVYRLPYSFTWGWPHSRSKHVVINLLHLSNYCCVRRFSYK